MPGEQLAIILLSAAVSVAGIAFATLATQAARGAASIVGVVAGVVLLLVAGFHLVPEVLHEGGLAPIFLVGGALVGLAVEFAFRTPAAQASPEMGRLAARLGVMVLALHSLLDGAVYNAAFWHHPSTGLMASLGLVMHEAPEGVVATLLGLQAGLRVRGAVLVALLASTVTTPLGWGLAHLLEGAAHQIMHPMFAASAGLLVYVGWHLIADGLRSLRARRG